LLAVVAALVVLTGCGAAGSSAPDEPQARSLSAAPATSIAAPGANLSPDGGASSAELPPSTSSKAPLALQSSPPVRVEIPALGTDSELLDLGLQPDGTLEVPPDAVTVGWYTGGPTPGELGPAVIVGHVDWAGTQGVFYDLRNMVPGNQITVTRADGSVAVFEVRSNEQFPKDQFPTTAVYGDIDHSGLRLITCGGSFDPAARSYLDNIVVFADLVGPTTA
jgi:hypothetical protein